jgi:hypothetical protein
VCKLGKGVALPAGVEMAEDSIDDPFATDVVVEAALDGVGGAHFPVVLLRTG